MRRGYVFIRGRTRHVTTKVVLTSLCLAAVAAAAVPQGPPAGAERPRALAQVSCADFDNRDEARAYLHGASAVERARLDDDNDGVPCERLP